MAKLFQTGDSSNDDLTNITLESVSDVWFRRAFLRALLLLTDENNWQQDGTATIDYARDKANELYVSATFDVPAIAGTPVGATMIWHMSTPPDRWLICDGSGVLKSEYPQLYALLGGKYGESVDFFGLPDLFGRSPFGADFSVELDDTAGSLTHTLTIAEIPSHRHRIPKASATVNAAVNTTLANARTDTALLPDIQTDLMGGGGSHNNLHPVLGVNFIIYAGLP
jgi:microcystin-dependent protein